MRKIRVLHVIPGLSCGGGVQVRLLQFYQHFDRERYHFDFLPENFEDCSAAESIEVDLQRLGCSIYKCPQIRRRFPFGRRIRAVLGNSYDILHQHNMLGASLLLEGKRVGIPVRIVHVHNPITPRLTTGILPGRLLRHLQVFLSKRYASHGLAVSDASGTEYFGRAWNRDPRLGLMLQGVEFSPFQLLPDKKAVRDSLGIPEGYFVIGHVGRLATQKNLPFIVRIMAEVQKRNRCVRFLWIGDGPLRDVVVRQVHEAQLADAVIFTGRRKDVPALMTGAMDAFLLPSLYEGLGLVVVEAQAAGLPCLISDVIPREADIVSGLIHRLSLAESAETWANKLLEIQQRRSDYAPQQTALQEVLASPFDIRQAAVKLTRFYEDTGVGIRQA